MSDHFPGKIQIGGTLNLVAPQGQHQGDWDDLIARLLTYLNDTAPDFDSNYHSVEHARDLRKVAEKGNGVITGCDDNATGGQFDDLEEVCRELGLEYDRWSNSFCEYEGEFVRWRPGMNEPLVVEANNSETAICDRSPVLNAFKILTSMADSSPASLALVKANVNQALNHLRSALYTGEEPPVEPVDLSPFRIIP